MKKIKTSVSLPAETMATIKKYKANKESHKKLALFCLKRYLSKNKISEFEKKPTCTYNANNSSEIMTIWLTPEEHHNLKIYRITSGLSISFLIDIAINMYLAYILRLSARKLNTSHATITRHIWLILESQISAIHRNVKFSYDKIVYLSIVMPKKKIRQSFKGQNR